MADTPPPASERLKLLVPTNFSAKSEQALRFALHYSHTQGRPAEVFLFHSYDEKNVDYRRLDKINEECVDRMKVAVLHCIEQMGQEGLSHAVEMVHRRLSYGKPAAEILKMAGGIGADMIIMGCPSSSNFRRLIEKTPCSLVLVKDKDPTFVMD
jgi:nucleotide-binding universal stress UspA family protein